MSVMTVVKIKHLLSRWPAAGLATGANQHCKYNAPSRIYQNFIIHINNSIPARNRRSEFHKIVAIIIIALRGFQIQKIARIID